MHGAMAFFAIYNHSFTYKEVQEHYNGFYNMTDNSRLQNSQNWTVNVCAADNVTEVCKMSNSLLIIPPDVTISLSNSPVNLGDLLVLESNNTTDNSPLPFIIQNDGGVSINVTIESTDLWTRAANPTSKYQFKCGDSSEVACAVGSQTSFTNIPVSGNPSIVIAFLSNTNSIDTNEVELNATVPSDEPGGSKGSVITFTASQA